MTNETTAGADIVADAREWLSNHSGRVTTHGDECHRWHDACLIARLVEECERLRNAAGEYTHSVSAGIESKPARTGGAVNGPPDRRTGCGECATLTDAEREAIEGAIIHMETRGVWAWPATLRALLERLG